MIKFKLTRAGKCELTTKACLTGTHFRILADRKRRLRSPLRLPKVSRSKQGYNCLAPPDLHREIDTTTCMDGALTPDPVTVNKDSIRVCTGSVLER